MAKGVRRLGRGIMVLAVGSTLAFAGCAETMMAEDKAKMKDEGGMMKKEGGSMKKEKGAMEKKQ